MIASTLLAVLLALLVLLVLLTGLGRLADIPRSTATLPSLSRGGRAPRIRVTVSCEAKQGEYKNKK